MHIIIKIICMFNHTMIYISIPVIIESFYWVSKLKINESKSKTLYVYYCKNKIK